MIDISKLSYRVYSIQGDGTQLNITEAVTALGWNEAEKEISMRTTATIANVEYNGKRLSSWMAPNTIIVVTANTGDGEKEVARGTIVEWSPTRSNAANSFIVTAYDELYNLQQSQDDRYITAGTGTKSAITAMFDDWGIPIGEYRGPNISHAKTIYKNQYLSDIALALLDDAEKHGSEKYIIRAKAGKVYILPLADNSDVYHFSADKNATIASDKISTSDLVTRVKVMGLADDDGKQSPEAIVDGLTEYGIRQRVYNRSQDDTLETAKEAAQKTIDEQGKPDRTTTVDAPDVPYIRKGDKISLDLETLAGFFTVASISHDAQDRSMTMTVKEYTEPEEKSADSGTEEKKDYKIGDRVQFHGGTHYVSSYAGSRGYSVSAGPATIRHMNPGSAHPYSLVTEDWNTTHVWGWVDEGSFT